MGDGVPDGQATCRATSQLYQAFLEGLVLFVIVNLLWRNEAIRRRPGIITGSF